MIGRGLHFDQTWRALPREHARDGWVGPGWSCWKLDAYVAKEPPGLLGWRSTGGVHAAVFLCTDGVLRAVRIPAHQVPA